MNIKKFSQFLVVYFLFMSLLTSPTIAQEEPETHIIKVSNNFYSPDYLEIEVGDTVIFEWTEEAENHNVAQVSSDTSLEPIENGFTSGDPADASFSYTLPDEYTQNNTTIYFICEPHASSGMRGSIKVGLGSTNSDTPILSITIVSIVLLLLPILRQRLSIQ